MRTDRIALVLVVAAAAAGAGFLMRDRVRRSPVSGEPVGHVADPSASPIETGRPSERENPAADAPTDDPAPSASSERGDAAPLPPHAKVDPRSATACPAGMVLVEGRVPPAVLHECADEVGSDPTASPEAPRPVRCRRFKPQVIGEGPETDIHVCIDRFEYPNLPGVRPATMVDYREAARACAVEGKRLCEADEWALACEGPRTWPYPQGIDRSSNACTIDRPWRAPNPQALARPVDVALEVERLDQRTASGAQPGCVSAFGVFDLTGNVSEWVHDRRGGPDSNHRDTGIAGGGWEPSASTCRTLNSLHGPEHRGHMTGFRCCANALDGIAPARDAGTGAAGRRIVRPLP